MSQPSLSQSLLMQRTSISNYVTNAYLGGWGPDPYPPPAFLEPRFMSPETSIYTKVKSVGVGLYKLRLTCQDDNT